jgi:pyruvate,water dikinase
MRDLSSRMYYRIRRYALEIAKRRGIGDDVFFMTFREILEDDRSQVPRNREIYESYRNFKAPNEIGHRFAFDGSATQGEMRGIGASQGTVRGVARVAHTVEEAMRVEIDAVLVCPYTDPGWTSVLDRVAGVVTETGGLLSHAAVICREYGIPAVLGIPKATQRIPEGRTVIVRGDDGYVDLVD